MDYNHELSCQMVNDKLWESRERKVNCNWFTSFSKLGKKLEYITKIVTENFLKILGPSIEV